jgi:hypothetical protein
VGAPGHGSDDGGEAARPSGASAIVAPCRRAGSALETGELVLCCDLLADGRVAKVSIHDGLLSCHG